MKHEYSALEALRDLKEDLKDEVLDFIKKRWANTDGNWFNGNCYWFAKILCERFRRLEVYYLPIMGHFVAGDGAHFYDASGEVTPDEEPWSFKRIRQEDPLWYRHLLRDCGR